jgi:hypothetical protein
MAFARGLLRTPAHSDKTVIDKLARGSTELA